MLRNLHKDFEKQKYQQQQQQKEWLSFDAALGTKVSSCVRGLGGCSLARHLSSLLMTLLSPMSRTCSCAKRQLNGKCSVQPTRGHVEFH